jgi:hypothetical protein
MERVVPRVPRRRERGGGRGAVYEGLVGISVKGSEHRSDPFVRTAS